MWYTRESIHLELLLVSALVYIYIKHTQSYQVGVSITCFHGNLVWLININPTEEICVLLYNTYLCYIYNRDRYVQSKSIIKYFITFSGNVNLILPQVMRRLSSFYLIYTQRNCYSIDRLGSSLYVSRYHFSFERILLHYYKMIQTQAKSMNVDCSVHTKYITPHK